MSDCRACLWYANGRGWCYAHGWHLLAAGGILCAVADGLGSAARADEGSQGAVTAALDALEADLAAGHFVNPAAGDEPAIGDAIRCAFRAARATLECTAGTAPLRDYATTLLLAAATAHRTAVGQIGDGAVVGRWTDGRMETLSLPHCSEYANETTPLTNPDGLTRLQVRVWPRPVQALALLSDGPGD